MTLLLCDPEIPLPRAGTRPGHPFEARALPARLAAAAGFTGRLIGELRPDEVAIAGLLRGDDSERLAVIYRVTAGGDGWVPDVLYDHEGLEGVGVAGDPERPGEASADRVSAAVAGAMGAAISQLGPVCVVGVVGGFAARGELASCGLDLACRAAATHDRARLRREGDRHVEQTAELTAAIADRLRLTATQRARLARMARAAAIRGGRIPPPLLEEPAASVRTKAEGKLRLERIETALSEVARAEV